MRVICGSDWVVASRGSMAEKEACERFAGIVEDVAQLSHYLH